MKKAFVNSLPKSGTNLVGKCLELFAYQQIHGFASSEVLSNTFKAKKTVDLDVAMQVRKGRKIGGINQFVKDPATAELIRQDVLSRTGIDLGSA